VTGAAIGANRAEVSDGARSDSRFPVDNRRGADRYDVAWSVDCQTSDTFLYASIQNISAMGIFVATREPLEVGTRVTLTFAPPGISSPFVLAGVVQWVNPVRLLSENRNPGMGVRFETLEPEDRERLVASIRTIAYIRDTAN
jgi:type IV pilus assembly protein PilZ